MRKRRKKEAKKRAKEREKSVKKLRHETRKGSQYFQKVSSKTQSI